ncbi:MAG: YegS/Rv2252/BmrU family lipid kinase [Eubacteriales bacterium]|nr:YegS/Rv2252/BmrU family lipid kinase [Eubacteriales bacterium]
MKYLFIVNPIAGGSDHTEQIRTMAEKEFKNRPNDEYEIYVTKDPFDAAREVSERAETGENLYILACGGDGTFNLCCNGAAGHDNIAVAPFPVGTGNDFCRMFGEQKDLYLNLPALLDGSTHKIDLASVNGRYCACIASVGFDARIGINVHKYDKLPLCKGPGAYIASLVVETFKGMTRSVSITCGDFSYSGPYTLCAVCNGRYYGGGFNPVRDALPDDGILDIVLVKKISLPAFFLNVGKYKKGRADSLPQYFTHLKSDHVTFEFDEESVINCDGEALYGKKVEIQLYHNCMNLIVPKGLTFFS